MFITTEDYKKVSSLTFSDSIKDFKNYEQIEKLKSAAASAVAKSSRHPKSRITSLMSRLQPNVPSAIPTP